jgi:predicted ArsR family transcriptional regulator
MLSKIIKLLKEHGPLSLKELATQFHTELSAMEGMLDMLESKNRITRVETKCSKCKGCIEVKREDALIFKAS